MRHSEVLIPILLELIILAALFSAGFLVPSRANCSSSSQNNIVHFTIIESDTGSMEGMNGSALLPAGTSWPILRVHECQTVVISVSNVNSSEPHGFAISHYFDTPNGQSIYPGVELYPNQSFTVQFVADELGTFRVFCSVFCAIHPLMQNGELIVSP
jgi:FtsP/CotA-like multicopper oxidase with cupredoxin domain